VPSRRESFGLTLLEAMTAGVPVVASNIPAFQELVGASEGVALLPLEEPAAWSAQILRLLDHPAYAREAARAAGVRAQDFSPALVTHALLEAWRSPERRGRQPGLGDLAELCRHGCRSRQSPIAHDGAGRRDAGQWAPEAQ